MENNGKVMAVEKGCKLTPWKVCFANEWLILANGFKFWLIFTELATFESLDWEEKTDWKCWFVVTTTLASSYCVIVCRQSTHPLVGWWIIWVTGFTMYQGEFWSWFNSTDPGNSPVLNSRPCSYWWLSWSFIELFISGVFNLLVDIWA